LAEKWHEEGYNRAMIIAEQLRVESQQQGIQYGRQEGLQEGIQKGIQKGIQRVRLIALELLRGGALSFAEIAKLTKLPTPDLVDLQQTIQDEKADIE